MLFIREAIFVSLALMAVIFAQARLGNILESSNSDLGSQDIGSVLVENAMEKSGSVIKSMKSEVMHCPPLDSGITSQLVTATGLERIQLLANDCDFVFDFLNPPNGARVTGQAGSTVAGNRRTFPALIGNGVSMTLGFLGPCGLNTPHTHPRASEFNLIVNGTVLASFVLENGARTITNELSAGQAAVFPQGSIHFEQNLGCDSVLFVAAFSDEDPGVTQTAERFFGLSEDFVGASLGGLGVEEVRQIRDNIPASVALGTAECRARCGIEDPSEEAMPTGAPTERVKFTNEMRKRPSCSS